ncbi:nitrate- and nitrite sensing domain-containing protein [Nonomuraea sp. NBC_01738]|uniref:sensor histidine kinase n=1 Tax=Nonomuraea sp. NBC_01738 TaxID=2976003 RepID=UPI002E141245|nr:nitrate- and nitrite sensing domain-containing protein [Nonomuraea sp. NBC_01738]
MASGRSIRFKISALLVIPLVSLVALWGFAAGTTSGEALNLLKVDTLWRGAIDHADHLVDALQTERLASAEQLAESVSDPAALVTARAATDKARRTFLEQAGSDDTRSALTPEMQTQLNETFEAVAEIAETRKQVDGGAMTAAELVGSYSLITDAVHRLYASFALGTDMELYRQARGLIAADQVRELISREHALVVAANGNLSDADRQLLARVDGARIYMGPRAMGDLDVELRAPFEKIDTTSMDRMISGYLNGANADVELWRGIADPVLKGYSAAVGGNGEVLLARMEPAGMAIVVRAAVAGLLGLIAVAFSIFISVRVGRRLTRELAGLRRSALELAELRLPELVTKLRKGDSVDLVTEAAPITVPAGATSELVDLAAAFDSVQSTAVEAAVEQARLRQGIAEALRNLARRSQSLVQRQLRLLDEMQSQTEDPEALERLFRLDHLTTRMRRHAEGLVLLSGGSAGRRWRGSIPVEDVLSGAAAQVEEYTRVRVYPMPECGVSGGAVADLMHLFAELMENGASFSSPGNEVSVRGELVGRGFAVEIEDRGLGMTEEARRAVNERLASPQEFDPAQTERLGFAVVGMLAARHGATVTLKPSPYGGTTAIVLLPSSLIGPLPTAGDAPLLESVSVSVVREVARAESGLPRRTRTIPAPAPTLADVPELMESAGLPRRVRQANLPPKLRQPQPQTEERSPEEARALLSSLQSGWQRGRQEGEQDGGSES